MASDSAARRPILALAPRLRGRVNTIVGIGLLVLVALWLVVNFVRDPQQFVLVFLAGITNGSIYALVALGYTIVYGILELINFAHGDVFTWGAMVTYTVAVSWVGLDGSQTGLSTSSYLSCSRSSARPSSARRSTWRSSASPTGAYATHPDWRR